MTFSFTRFSMDKVFTDSGLRTYQIRYEGQKDNLLDEPVIIYPNPHISDLGVTTLERPSFAKEDGLNIRQYSVKFSKATLIELSAQLETPLNTILSRNGRFGILKPEPEAQPDTEPIPDPDPEEPETDPEPPTEPIPVNNWIAVRPLSEPVEKMTFYSNFLSVIFQPVKGPY